GGTSTTCFSAKCCGRKRSGCCRSTIAGLRSTLRSCPLPALTAVNYGLCLGASARASTAMGQGQGRFPLPLHPFPSQPRRRKCQVCARSKLSGIPPAVQGTHLIYYSAVHLVPHLHARSLIRVRYAEQCAGSGRQNVADPEVDHAEMGILGITRRDIPGGTSQVGILRVGLQCPISCTVPEGLYPIESQLLNAPVVCIGRPQPAISDEGARMPSICGVGERIPRVVIRAVINGERLLRTGSPLETCRNRSAMKHRQTDVRAGSIWPNHYLRSCSDQVVCATNAPKCIGQQRELWQQFIV